MQSLKVYLVLIVIWIILPITASANDANTIVVDLSKGANDPLIDFVPPPFGSADRATFSKEGLRIRQTTDSARKPTGVAGFKSTLAATGDFRAELDLKVYKLSAPSDGWGHGVIFSVFLADPLQTTLKLNQIALKGSAEGEVRTVAEISGRKITEPTYIDGPPLNDGVLIIERVGAKATFSILPVGVSEPTVIAQTDCPVDDVNCIEVWSTRVEKGNAAADVLLRRLTLKANSFYSYKESDGGWLSWWTLAIAGQILILLGLVVYMQSKK